MNSCIEYTLNNNKTDSQVQWVEEEHKIFSYKKTQYIKLVKCPIQYHLYSISSTHRRGKNYCDISSVEQY